jgi:hypothetical protein
MAIGHQLSDVNSVVIRASTYECNFLIAVRQLIKCQMKALKMKNGV